MLKVFQRFKIVVLCLLALVLGTGLLTEIWPGVNLVPLAEGQEGGEGGLVNVYRYPNGRADPVQITKITERGNEVEGVYWVHHEVPGQPIPNTEDWIGNLSISIKNVTDLKIQFVSIRLNFFYSDDTHDVVNRLVDLGQVPVGAEPPSFKGKIPLGTGHPLEFGPGQEMTVPLSGLADEIKAKIRAKTPLSSVTKCIIGTSYAYFAEPDRELTYWNGIAFSREPGLKWDGAGGWSLPNPDNPGRRKYMSNFFPGDTNRISYDPVPSK